jgi:hypothetical protein
MISSRRCVAVNHDQTSCPSYVTFETTRHRGLGVPRNRGGFLVGVGSSQSPAPLMPPVVGSAAWDDLKGRFHACRAAPRRTRDHRRLRCRRLRVRHFRGGDRDDRRLGAGLLAAHVRPTGRGRLSAGLTRRVRSFRRFEPVPPARTAAGSCSRSPGQATASSSRCRSSTWGQQLADVGELGAAPGAVGQVLRAGGGVLGVHRHASLRWVPDVTRMAADESTDEWFRLTVPDVRGE